MAQISTQLDSGQVTFTFEDLDGHTFSRIRINPADVAIAKRAEEVSGFFDSISGDFESPQELADEEREIGEKLNYLLGYKSYDDAFGEIGPLTLLPDGTFFVEHVMEKITDSIGEILAERQAKIDKGVAKYTGKYRKKKE